MVKGKGRDLVYESMFPHTAVGTLPLHKWTPAVISTLGVKIVNGLSLQYRCQCVCREPDEDLRVETLFVSNTKRV